MIKIISKGTRQVRQCEVCGCKFSYDAEDVISGTYDGIDEIYRGQYIYCPQCDNRIDLFTKAIAKDIKK